MTCICRIPGQLSDRRTMLGELNWIFTAITDTIAWNTLPRGKNTETRICLTLDFIFLTFSFSFYSFFSSSYFLLLHFLLLPFPLPSPSSLSFLLPFFFHPLLPQSPPSSFLPLFLTFILISFLFPYIVL